MKEEEQRNPSISHSSSRRTHQFTQNYSTFQEDEIERETFLCIADLQAGILAHTLAFDPCLHAISTNLQIHFALNGGLAIDLQFLLERVQNWEGFTGF
eukprot:c20663_g1_i1 orf=117-410(+)